MENEPREGHDKPEVQEKRARSVAEKVATAVLVIVLLVVVVCAVLTLLGPAIGNYFYNNTWGPR